MSIGKHLEHLQSPLIMTGNTFTAFRDPCLIFEKGTYYLFYSLVRTEEDNLIYWYVAMSTSTDMMDWSAPKIITPRGQDLNYSSPGSVIRYKNEWILSTQSYPMPGRRRYDPKCFGNATARVFLMRSKDLHDWGEPEMIWVKGRNTSWEETGTMIDSFIFPDRHDPEKMWCCFKQNGMGYSYSHDLIDWTYVGTQNIGENVCVLAVDDEYLVYHSPENGMGLIRSKDMQSWNHEEEILTFGQKDWPWAETRITAGHVTDLRHVPEVGKYVMTWHSMGPGTEKHTGNIDASCHLGISWSDDLVTWDWPQKGKPFPTAVAACDCARMHGVGWRGIKNE